MEEYIYCPNCGFKNQQIKTRDFVFCKKCGYKITYSEIIKEKYKEPILTSEQIAESSENFEMKPVVSEGSTLNLKTTDVIRMIMREKCIKIKDLASLENVSAAAITMRLRQKNISIEKANQMLTMLGYKFVIMPSTERVSDGWYEVQS